jgi:hypothetical protein
VESVETLSDRNVKHPSGKRYMKNRKIVKHIKSKKLFLKYKGADKYGNDESGRHFYYDCQMHDKSGVKCVKNIKEDHWREARGLHPCRFIAASSSSSSSTSFTSSSSTPCARERRDGCDSAIKNLEVESEAGAIDEVSDWGRSLIEEKEKERKREKKEKKREEREKRRKEKEKKNIGKKNKK